MNGAYRMECRVLGGLEVLDNGFATTPTAPKLRSTLAMLLVHHNRTVSRTTMIDELWPSNPPATAVMSLNTYVYQLRRLLARGPSQWSNVLLTKPGGYEMAIPPESLDLSVFESTVVAGRRDAAAGRLTDASSHLRRALALPRGSVLAGLDKGPLLSGIAARLDEDILDTIALRIEIDLQLGRHRELIGELRGLVAEYPMNEDLYAKLIVALYRSERRWVALDTYQKLRQSLRHQFGMDPSPRLQRLHQDMLTDAPSLLTSTAAGVLVPAGMH